MKDRLWLYAALWSNWTQSNPIESMDESNPCPTLYSHEQESDDGEDDGGIFARVVVPVQRRHHGSQDSS